MRPDFEPDLPHEILENNAQFVLKKLQLQIPFQSSHQTREQTLQEFPRGNYRAVGFMLESC
jgi:hypothetical protein